MHVFSKLLLWMFPSIHKRKDQQGKCLSTLILSLLLSKCYYFPFGSSFCKEKMLSIENINRTVWYVYTYAHLYTCTHMLWKEYTIILIIEYQVPIYSANFYLSHFPCLFGWVIYVLHSGSIVGVQVKRHSWVWELSLEDSASELTLQLSSLSGRWGRMKEDTERGPSHLSAGWVKSRQLVMML